jgi:hypothetical protein
LLGPGDLEALPTRVITTEVGGRRQEPSMGSHRVLAYEELAVRSQLDPANALSFELIIEGSSPRGRRSGRAGREELTRENDRR